MIKHDLYHMKDGTFRNNISKLRKPGEVKCHIRCRYTIFQMFCPDILILQLSRYYDIEGMHWTELAAGIFT